MKEVSLTRMLLVHSSLKGAKGMMSNKTINFIYTCLILGTLTVGCASGGDGGVGNGMDAGSDTEIDTSRRDTNDTGTDTAEVITDTFVDTTDVQVDVPDVMAGPVIVGTGSTGEPSITFIAGEIRTRENNAIEDYCRCNGARSEYGTEAACVAALQRPREYWECFEQTLLQNSLNGEGAFGYGICLNASYRSMSVCYDNGIPLIGGQCSALSIAACRLGSGANFALLGIEVGALTTREVQENCEDRRSVAFDDDFASCADQNITGSVGSAPRCPDATLPTNLSGRVALGTTVGAGNQFSSSCGGNRASDVIFAWTAPSDGPKLAVFDTVGSGFDTILYVKEGTCPGLVDSNNCQGGNCCNDDIDVANDRFRSQVFIETVPGKTYYIVVDGFRPEDAGRFVLNATVTNR